MAGLLASMEINPDRRPTDFEVAEEIHGGTGFTLEEFLRRFRQLEEQRIRREEAKDANP